MRWAPARAGAREARWRGRPRLTGAALVALCIAVAAPSPAVAASRARVRPRPSPPVPRALPHVVHRAGEAYIADQRGRFLFLRGVAANALIQYASDFQEEVPATAQDFAEMAALGFDVVRLPVSWSRIEPEPGQFDPGYLEQIAQLVRWAQSAGLYVWVDMHQDRYNRNLWPGQEVDGAPDWATITDGVPCLALEATTACAQAAAQNFWDDAQVAGEGLQEHYLQALLAVSRRLRSDRSLLGIELMNEPTPGFVAPPAFERLELWPFYQRMIAGLRQDGEHRMLWFEPNLLRDVTDVDSGAPAPFSGDPDLVYAPHIYTEVFSPPQQPSGVKAHLRASFQTAELEARAYGAPLVDGEWGGGAGGSWEQWMSDELDLQDQYVVGSAFWIWKQQPGFYNWQTVQIDGSLRPDSMRAQMLSRPHPDAVPGVLESISYTPGLLRVRVTGHGGIALLWSGTEVLAGGPTLLRQPLTAATVDGHPAAVGLTTRRFTASKVSLLGYLVRLRVPPGEHTIALRAGGG